MGTSQAFAAQSRQCQAVPWWSARNATALPWVRQLLSSLPWISVSKTVVCTRWKWRTERLSFEGEGEIARTWRRWCWTSAESPSWSCNLNGMCRCDIHMTLIRGCCLRSSRYHSQYPSASRMDHSPICWRLNGPMRLARTGSHDKMGELMAYPSGQRSSIDGGQAIAAWRIPMNKWMMTIGELPPFLKTPIWEKPTNNQRILGFLKLRTFSKRMAWGVPNWQKVPHRNLFIPKKLGM